MPMSCSQK